MTEQLDPAMEAEFDTVAIFTGRVVEALGPEYAIPAACRGSGNPVWLEWLATGLDMQAGDYFLDVGAGLGGPAAWLRDRSGPTACRPVLAEPMQGACSTAGKLFGLPTAAAWSQSLPFADGTFEAAWSLGVLCTTEDQLAVLREIRRVLKPGGRLGLLVFLQVGNALTAVPQGNHFRTAQNLRADLDAAGFVIDAETPTTALPAPDELWSFATREFEAALERRYRGHPMYQQAAVQERQIGRLLQNGDLESRLVLARCQSRR